MMPGFINGFPWQYFRFCELSWRTEPEFTSLFKDISTNIEAGGFDVSIENIAEHCTGFHERRILSLDEPHHSVSYIFVVSSLELASG